MDLSLLDGFVCVAYLLVVFALAVRSAKGQRDNEDYFLGGRKMNWFVVGVSMFATSFSSISFLGIPQRWAYQDFSFYVTIVSILVVITPVLWWVFVPVYVRLRVGSGYEYLGMRSRGYSAHREYQHTRIFRAGCSEIFEAMGGGGADPLFLAGGRTSC